MKIEAKNERIKTVKKYFSLFYVVLLTNLLL